MRSPALLTAYIGGIPAGDGQETSINRRMTEIKRRAWGSQIVATICARYPRKRWACKSEIRGIPPKNRHQP